MKSNGRQGTNVRKRTRKTTSKFIFKSIHSSRIVFAFIQTLLALKFSFSLFFVFRNFQLAEKERAPNDVHIKLLNKKKTVSIGKTKPAHVSNTFKYTHKNIYIHIATAEAAITNFLSLSHLSLLFLLFTADVIVVAIGGR